MRKKLGTRFPAARIKKIMQADEDVGKIAMAVPVLVSRALELFLQDLIDRTYKITLQSGAKTLNSFHLPMESLELWKCLHLEMLRKQCVKRYSSFDFLTEIVNKVPDLGGADSCGDERGLPRRRKALSNGSDPENEESRSGKMAIRSSNISPRGRGRGRGRGRPPTKRKEVGYVQFEDESSMFAEQGEPLPGDDIVPETIHSNESISQSRNPPVDAPSVAAPAASSKVGEANTDHQPDWPMPEGIGNIGVGPSGFGHLTVQVDEDEDYDNED